MAKTPKRRKPSDENGTAAAAAPETPENGQQLKSPPASRLRSRKRTRPSNEDDSSAGTSANEEDGEPAAKRRSTRRGRRKKSDDEDTVSMASSTDDEQSTSSRRKQRRTRQTRNGHSSDADDKVMTEDSSEDEAAKKPRAQNGHHASSNVASLPTVAEDQEEETSKPAALAPISKLRMPSKHTPGKLQTTAPAPTRAGKRRGATNVLEELPPTVGGAGTTTSTRQEEEEEVVTSPPGVGNEELNAILANQEDETPPPPPAQQPQHSWVQILTTALTTLVWTVSDVLTSLVVPQVEQFAEEEEEEEIAVQVTKPLLTRTYIWFLLLFVLQFLFLEPIVDTVEEASNKSLDFLLNMFPKQEEMPVETMEPTVVLPSWSDDHVQQLESLSTRLQSMQDTSKFQEELEFAQRQLIQIRGRLTEKGQAIDDWQSGLVDVEGALTDLHSTTSLDDVPRLFFRANEILGFFKDMVPPSLKAPLLDTTYVFLWEIASSNECRPARQQDSNNNEDDDPILTKETWQMGQDELRQMMLVSATELLSKDDVLTNVQSWVREALPEHDTSRAQQQEEETPTNGLSQDMVRDVIRQVLETERADQLGLVDYASILAGASVIDRATTPSLVDSLPLLNRLLRQARLRFYGYGPEAALTPTVPVNALGQCWAFERHSKRKGGKYATLTVALGQPVYVTQVVVEHAPKELTDAPETAIQQFRILGYEDKDATDEPWNLGSFQYDIDAPRMLQQFQVANRANGELIPKLQSIALAIDSNWGSNYSCLYRFRVLGGDEPSEDAIEVDIIDSFDDEYDADSDNVESIDNAQQETKEQVELEVESEDVADSSRHEEHPRDFVEEEPERVSDGTNEEAKGSSDDATETDVAAERISVDENEEETSESTTHHESGDSTNDSEDTAREDTSGSEDDADSGNVEYIHDAQQETKEEVELKVESEDVADSSRQEERPRDFVKEEPERVSDDMNEEAKGSSDDGTETDVAAERISVDENEVETSESTIRHDSGDSTSGSKDTPREDTSGSEDSVDSEDDSHTEEPETEGSHHANVDDDEQMVNDVNHDTNDEDHGKVNENVDHEDVDDEEVHNWDNAEKDSGDDSGKHDSGDSTSGDHAHSQEQDSEDDSRDDSGDDSSDAEEHDSGDDSRDDEEEEYHDEH